MRTNSGFLRASAALLLAPALAQAGVIVVSSGGGGQYTNLQMAVNAASDGDTVLVKAGAYSSFTVTDKALTIVADGATPVTVYGTVVVQNLAASHAVVLTGLVVTGALTTSMADSPGAGLSVTGCAGPVRARTCRFEGSKGWGDGTSSGSYCCDPVNHFWGWPGAILSGNTAGVAFSMCALQGGRGSNANIYCYCGTGGDGGDALSVSGTLVALYDCSLLGGKGGDNGDLGGHGGAGCRAKTSATTCGVVASGCSFTGGHGGEGYDYLYSHGGDGGDGLVAESGTIAWLLDDTFAGGAPGLACGGVLPYPGLPGVSQSGTGQSFSFTGTRLSLVAPTPVREASSFQATFTGAPGSRVYLVATPGTGFQPIPSWNGVVLTESATRPRVVGMGTVPAGGTLIVPLSFPDLGPGVAAETRYLQTYLEDGSGGVQLGSFIPLTILDSAY